MQLAVGDTDMQWLAGMVYSAQFMRPAGIHTEDPLRSGRNTYSAQSTQRIDNTSGLTVLTASVRVHFAQTLPSSGMRMQEHGHMIVPAPQRAYTAHAYYAY